MAQALSYSIMYNNHHYPQQSQYVPQSHPQYYASSYPHYNVQSSSVSANQYTSAAAYGLGVGVDEMGAGAIQPTGADRSARMDRRRPKYTRSKLGCLTCRRKKVKCDEVKPTCTRCTNSGLGCTWPEAPPPKKKASSSRSTSKRASDSPISPTDPSSASHSTVDFSAPAASDVESSRQETVRFGEEVKREEHNEDLPTPHEDSFGFKLANERRHSEPQFSALTPPAPIDDIENRRHSIVEGAMPHQQQQVSYGPGALGLTLNQIHAQDQVKSEGQTPALSYSSLASHSRAESRSGSRPATPNDPYTQQPAHNFPGAPGWSLGITVPQMTCGSTGSSSRPSTASSLSLSHVQALRRASATSYGTGSGSPPTTGGSAPTAQNQQFSWSSTPKPYGDMSARSSIDMSAGVPPGMMPGGGYGNVTRTSMEGASMGYPNANTAESPYARPSSFDNRVQVSPFMTQNSSPLAQPQPSHTQQGYFAQMNQLAGGSGSRPQSPWGTRATF